MLSRERHLVEVEYIAGHAVYPAAGGASFWLGMQRISRDCVAVILALSGSCKAHETKPPLSFACLS